MEHLVTSVIQDLVEKFKNPPESFTDEEGSRIEMDFAWAIRKVTNDDVRIRRECDVDTDIGAFRLDFRLERLADGMAIGVECDGKDFHTPDSDAKRDTAIIRTGVVDKIYRITGRDVVFRLADSIQLLGICEPWILSERGRINLERQAHPKDYRDDHIGRSGVFFPFSAIRYYSRPEGEEWSRNPRDYRPTILPWTQK